MSMPRILSTVAAAGLCAGLSGAAGCASAGAAVQAPGASLADTVKSHTGRSRDYQGLVRTVDMSATVLSPALRAQLAQARGTRVFGKTVSLLAQELDAHPESTFVLIAFALEDRTERELAATGSIWQVSFLTGRNPVTAAALDAVALDASTRALLPHVRVTDELVLARFDGVAPGTPGSVVVQSAIGRVRVAFSGT